MLKRSVTVFVAAVLGAQLVALSAVVAAPVEEVFKQFELFGDWAADCKQAASPANPHVSIVAPSPGLVLEDHNLGADFAVNRYSVLTAAKVSATRLSVDVIFQPGTANEERQRLIFQIRKSTRRTMFNQAEGGPVRVKDGIALALGTRTPVLNKCQ